MRKSYLRKKSANLKASRWVFFFSSFLSFFCVWGVFVCLFVWPGASSLSGHHSNRITYVIPRPKINIKLNQLLSPFYLIGVTFIFHFGVRKEWVVSKTIWTWLNSEGFSYLSKCLSKLRRAREKLRVPNAGGGDEGRRQKNGYAYKNMPGRRALHRHSFLWCILCYWDSLSILIHETLYLENVLVCLLWKLNVFRTEQTIRLRITSTSFAWTWVP